MLKAVQKGAEYADDKFIAEKIIIDVYADHIDALTLRWFDKLRQLIDTYKYQEDKFVEIAVLIPVLRVVSANHKKMSEFETEIAKWAKEVWNHYMKKLVEEHDYRAIHPLGHIMLCSAFAGVKEAAKCNEYLGNALTFRVEGEYKDALGTAYVCYLSGEAVVSMNKHIGGWIFEGEDTVNARIDSYTQAYGSFGNVVGINLPSFNNNANNARISNLDPCIRKKIMVGFDKFDEDIEFDIQTPATDSFPSSVGSMSAGLPTVPFYDRFNRAEGFYDFECDIANLKENCVDEKISGSYTQGAKLVWTLTISLFHAPKEDVFMK
jgi:hypothetical protein